MHELYKFSLYDDHVFELRDNLSILTTLIYWDSHWYTNQKEPTKRRLGYFLNDIFKELSIDISTLKKYYNSEKIIYRKMNEFYKLKGNDKLDIFKTCSLWPDVKTKNRILKQKNILPYLPKIKSIDHTKIPNHIFKELILGNNILTYELIQYLIDNHSDDIFKFFNDDLKHLALSLNIKCPNKYTFNKKYNDIYFMDLDEFVIANPKNLILFSFLNIRIRFDNKYNKNNDQNKSGKDSGEFIDVDEKQEIKFCEIIIQKHNKIIKNKEKFLKKSYNLIKTINYVSNITSIYDLLKIESFIKDNTITSNEITKLTNESNIMVHQLVYKFNKDYKKLYSFKLLNKGINQGFNQKIEVKPNNEIFDLLEQIEWSKFEITTIDGIVDMLKKYDNKVKANYEQNFKINLENIKNEFKSNINKSKVTKNNILSLDKSNNEINIHSLEKLSSNISKLNKLFNQFKFNDIYKISLTDLREYSDNLLIAINSIKDIKSILINLNTEPINILVGKDKEIATKKINALKDNEFDLNQLPDLNTSINDLIKTIKEALSANVVKLDKKPIKPTKIRDKEINEKKIIDKSSNIKKDDKTIIKLDDYKKSHDLSDIYLIMLINKLLLNDSKDINYKYIADNILKIEINKNFHIVPLLNILFQDLLNKSHAQHFKKDDNFYLLKIFMYAKKVFVLSEIEELGHNITSVLPKLDISYDIVNEMSLILSAINSNNEFTVTDDKYFNSSNDFKSLFNKNEAGIIDNKYTLSRQHSELTYIDTKKILNTFFYEYDTIFDRFRKNQHLVTDFYYKLKNASDTASIIFNYNNEIKTIISSLSAKTKDMWAKLVRNDISTIFLKESENIIKSLKQRSLNISKNEIKNQIILDVLNDYLSSDIHKIKKDNFEPNRKILIDQIFNDSSVRNYNIDIIKCIYNNRDYQISNDIIREQMIESINTNLTKKLNLLSLKDFQKNDIYLLIKNNKNQDYLNKYDEKKFALSNAISSLSTNNQPIVNYYIEKDRLAAGESVVEIYKDEIQIKNKNKKSTNLEDKPYLEEMIYNILQDKDYIKLKMDNELFFLKFEAFLISKLKDLKTSLTIDEINDIFVQIDYCTRKYKDRKFIDFNPTYSSKNDDEIKENIIDINNLTNQNQYSHFSILANKFNSLRKNNILFNNSDESAREDFTAFADEFCKQFSLNKGIFHDIDDIPYIITETYQYERFKNYTKRKILITTIHNKAVGQYATHKDIQDLTFSLNSRLKNDEDEYFLIFLCLDMKRQALEELEKISLHKVQGFDNITFINGWNLPDLLIDLTDNQNHFALLHKLKLKMPISTFQLFQDTDPVSTNPKGNKTLFVGRNLYLKEFTKDNGNFTIYGGRRIGKSSLAKEVLHKLESDKNYITGFGDVQSTTEYEILQNNGKKILIDLFFKLLNNFKEYSDFYNEYNQPNVDIDNLPWGDINRFISNILNKHKTDNFCLVIDECDVLLNALSNTYKKTDKYKDEKYEFFRTLLSINNCHNIKFIFVGFKTLYDHVNTFSALDIDSTKNPFPKIKGKVKKIDLFNKQEAEELIVDGLLNHLNLKFEDKNEGINYIISSSGRHPSFIQYFCHNLVENIKSSINAKNRIITSEDLTKTANQEYCESFNSFTTYVHETTELNLGNIGQALILTMSTGEQKNNYKFDENQLIQEFCEMIEVYVNKDVDIDSISTVLKKELTYLHINSIIERDSSKKIRFTNPFWIEYCKQSFELNTNEKVWKNKFSKAYEDAING